MAEFEYSKFQIVGKRYTGEATGDEGDDAGDGALYCIYDQTRTDVGAIHVQWIKFDGYAHMAATLERMVAKFEASAE